MKTIFRSTNLLLLLAAIIAIGAVAGMAQDPCTDADGQTKLQDEFDGLYAVKNDLSVRRKAIDSGKAFLEKYGACDSAKVRVDWLKVNVPKMETKYALDVAAAAENALINRFVTALSAKNFDETFASGKEAISKYPDKYRSFGIVLASIGFDEAYKGNAKYSDDGLRFAKAAIADLESGKEFTLIDRNNKPFTSYGFGAYSYKVKEDALGYMNLSAGFIINSIQKNKVGALPYLYKATQSGPEASKNPVAYELIGSYYLDELAKIGQLIATMEKAQSDTDTKEVAEQKVKDIKDKVAMSNGIAMRTIDAYSRAFTNSPVAAYKALMKKQVEKAYYARFGKEEPVDSTIAAMVAKPFVNPATPIEPIKDAEPAAPVAQPTTAPVTAPTNGGKPPVMNQAKPATTTPAKPAATPAKAPVKPRALVKKPVAKKKAA